jgi:hypothetical protein
MLKHTDTATLEHISLTVFRQTGQANSTFSALALAGFQVATFPTLKAWRAEPAVTVYTNTCLATCVHLAHIGRRTLT